LEGLPISIDSIPGLQCFVKTPLTIPDLADEICDRLSKGEPLASICRDEKMPEVRTVSDWKTAHPEFSADFTRAREDGFDALAAEALEIANTPVEGIIEKTTDKGVEVTREDMLGHRRLQIETRLKLLAKWSPKKYGEKLDIEHTGSMDVKVTIGGAGV